MYMVREEEGRVDVCVHFIGELTVTLPQYIITLMQDSAMMGTGIKINALK